MENKIRSLRIIGISEGVSFLVLLLIAMPLKYYMGLPGAVKLVGWLHGVLFMLYGLAVLICIKPMRWNFMGVLIALGASLIPLGTFVLDKQLKRRQQELAREENV